MSGTKGLDPHWVDIEPERMDRYEDMFRWSEATAAFYEPAQIRPGMTVADFGCGPGHAAIEFARRTAPDGHVHALDINAEFIRRTAARAQAAGLAGRIDAHLLDGARLPLGDASLDRVVARNTIIYVPDPVATLTEFRRCLRPGGLAHMIEGDWRLTAVAPVPTEDWRALIEAARWAWPWPEIGRSLYGLARKAGFEAVEVRVMTSPDMTGRLMGMIQTVSGYARQGGMDGARVDAILSTVERALAAGDYLAVSPQFIVTATAPG